MARKPAETPAEGEVDAGPCEREDEIDRIGSLAVARHVKDDGRALILYTRDERERK